MYGYVTLGTPAVVTRRRIEGVWFMAAVLPEFAFHDNTADAQWLVDSMEQIAEETVQAICEYYGVAYVPPAEDENGAPAEPSEPERRFSWG